MRIQVRKIHKLVAQMGQHYRVAHLKPKLPHLLRTVHSGVSQKTNGNDPSAGSPTETLLRLLLPLNDQV